jgi:hypothetical protein
MKILISLSAAAKLQVGARVAVEFGANEWYVGTVKRAGRNYSIEMDDNGATETVKPDEGGVEAVFAPGKITTKLSNAKVKQLVKKLADMSLVQPPKPAATKPPRTIKPSPVAAGGKEKKKYEPVAVPISPDPGEDYELFPIKGAKNLSISSHMQANLHVAGTPANVIIALGIAVSQAADSQDTDAISRACCLERVFNERGVTGVKKQVGYMLESMSSWKGDSADLCKHVLQTWANSK